MPAGRPSLYTPELVDSILERIAAGESLRKICDDDAMPERRTFNRWLENSPELVTKYAHAREEQAEFHHDDMDRLEALTEDGTLSAQAASVILTNKRWRMEKLKPKVYGAKVDHNHGGQKGNPFVAMISEVTGSFQPVEADDDDT